jgi:hypothetical protein
VAPKSIPNPKFPPKKALFEILFVIWLESSKSINGAIPEVYKLKFIFVAICSYILFPDSLNLVSKVPELSVLLKLSRLE